MDFWWLWLSVAVFALNYSAFTWRRVARGHGPDLTELLMAGGCGYLAWTYGEGLWSNGTLQQGVVAALWWSAATPLLAYLWHGRGGRIRRGLARAIVATLLFAAVTIAGTALKLDLGFAAGLGSLAALSFLTAPGLGHQWQRWRLRARQRRAERQTARAAQREQSREEHAWQHTERRAEQAEQRLRQAEDQITRLQSQETERRDRLEQQRHEIIVQVRQARAWERQQIQESGGLAVHPSSCGYILLEAGRVLRQEIAAGERIPPLENDQFLLEVAARLLAGDDFQERYLRQTGTDVAGVLHRHFQGEVPLSAVRTTLSKATLPPEHLAPVLVDGELLEAWLVPYRRYQSLQRQRYAAKQHPHQAVISDFLRPRCSGVPEPDQWQTFFDEYPRTFLQGRNEQERNVSSPEKRRLKTGLLAPSGTSAGRARGWISRFSSDK